MARYITYDFKKKRMIVQPISKDGLIAPPQILIVEGAWYQFFKWFWGVIRNMLAFVGLIAIIYWIGGF